MVVTFVDPLAAWAHSDQKWRIHADSEHGHHPVVSMEFSTDEWAATFMGPRVPEGESALAFDTPAELGYRCPVCKYQEALHWSEHRGYLWCEVCNKDWPSVLCVDVDAEPSEEWHQMGAAAAAEVFRAVVQSAVVRALGGGEGRWRPRTYLTS